MKKIHVAAAILRKDGRILICRRPKGKQMAGLWEFPGGKLEPGETAGQALVREMREELGVEIRVEGHFGTIHTQDATLDFLDCVLTGGELRSMEGQTFRLVYPNQLSEYEFCPADGPVVAALMKKPRFGHIVWDLDGTLLNTYPGMNKAMGLALKDFGIMADEEELKGLMKQSVRAAIAHYGVNEAQVRQVYSAYEKPLALEAKPMAGVCKMLKTIQNLGGKNHVYTHRDQLAKTLLERAFPGIVFGQVITVEDGFPLKPAPDALSAILKREGISKDDAIMIGDREIDVACAQNAGIAGYLFEQDKFLEDFQKWFI